jgi:hypothetical protein
MSEQVRVLIPISAYRFAGLSTFSVLAMTAFHHAYGAILYDTPWRFHVAVIAPILAAAIARALYLGGSRRGTRSGLLWTRIAAGTILVFPVGLIGLVEGGYNHVIKNLVYFLSGPQIARDLFPPPAYEMPDNFLFEITGIAQLPLALVAAYFAMIVLRRPPGKAP